MRERIDVLLAESEATLPDLLQKAQPPATDERGGFTSLLSREYEFLAVARYCAHGDVNAFFDGLRITVETSLRLFRRHNAGEAIPGSYVAMTAGTHLVLLALAVGDRALVDEVASVVGGRAALERDHDHPWDRSLGYALKAIWMGTDPGDHLEQFRRRCVKADIGIHTILSGICEWDPERVRDGFEQALKGHRRLSSVGGRWALTPQELVFLWGLGLLNLARAKGVPVEVESDMMPAELQRPMGMTA